MLESDWKTENVTIDLKKKSYREPNSKSVLEDMDAGRTQTSDKNQDSIRLGSILLFLCLLFSILLLSLVGHGSLIYFLGKRSVKH
jgi:hypothetical protein